MRPVGSFYQHIRQHVGDQLARCLFVEERHRVHGFKRARQFGPIILRNHRSSRTFQPLDAGVGIQRENQNVPERPRPFEQPNVPGMQNVITAVGEHYDLAVALPFGAKVNEFLARVS